MWPDVVCPHDGQRLIADLDVMVCPSDHRWRRDSGIPRIVSQPHNYTDAFGLQWKTFRRTQLDSCTGTTLSRDRAQRCLGEECWERLHSPTRSDVLEVGCGAGRFTEILLSTGAFVTSVDLSAAVEANQDNFPQGTRHRILQADVRHLPFVPKQYDLVFCLGVVQHTPRPEETIQRLYDQVRPGGWLVIDHYAPTLSRLTRSAFLFRVWLRRLPPEEGLKWSERLVDTFLPLHNAVRDTRIAKRLLSRVSPISACEFLPRNHELQREWSLLDTYDSLTDWYKHLRTKGQIRRTLESLGANSIWCEYGGNGVEARCQRPS
jgi:SAM-dependent methyltransferase